MEKLYIWIKKSRGYVYGTLFAFASSKFVALFDDASITDFLSRLSKLTEIEKISNALFWFALTICAVFFIADNIITHKINQKGLDKKFVDLMRKYTDAFLFDPGQETTGFSWGTNKTLAYCKNIIDGWTPRAIEVERFDPEKYQFEPMYQKEYLDFCSSSEMEKIIRDGDNLPRYMVSAFRETYNPKNPRLLFRLKSTEWSQTKYWWNKMKDRNLLSKEIADVYKYKKSDAPNSFCLHLVITTSDDKVVMARISTNKHNDYPETYAATIGEQVEKSDFLDTDFRKDFIIAWVRRALQEEFGFSDSRWEHFISADAIRVLALEMEGDIYNIALIVNVQVNMTYDVFFGEFGYSCTEKEISKIEPLDLSKIPSVLVGIDDNKGLYHPSTYLRLLMVYLHKFGQSKTYADILAAEQKKEKSRKFFSKSA